MAESRTRAYSSPVPSSGGSTTPVFRYTAGPGGPQIHYTGWNRPSSYHQINVTHGGRSRTDVFGNSLDQEEPDWERGEHQLMIGSLPLHLSPNLLGGTCVFLGLTVFLRPHLISQLGCSHPLPSLG
ncbi:unnamed protein product, partial [Oncorhynchus mykiss]